MEKGRYNKKHNFVFHSSLLSMKTYVTTATVIDGKILIQLPNDFRAEKVEVKVIATSKEQTLSTAQKIALLKKKSKTYNDTPIVSEEALRRENLYDDTGR